MSTETNIQPAEPSYYEKRMTELGITQSFNQVKLLENVDGKNELIPRNVFKPHPRGIEIIPYTLRRTNIRIEKEGSKIKKDWSIIRLETPIVKDNGETIKYVMPKGQGSYPLFTPNILDAFEAKQEIHTLVLTEGFFKAWKGYMAGLHMIGLPSITHMKDKDRKAIHPEIIDIIDRCNVKHIVWLTDGDCNDISKETEYSDGAGNKQLKDLYKRPNSFYSSISQFNQLLYDYKQVRKYFAYIDINNIITDNLFSPIANTGKKLSRDDVKGLDDLLISFPDREPEIVEDLLAISKPGKWFIKFDVTIHTGKVREHFYLDNPTRFYLHHMERRPDIKGKSFVFHGTQYKYNDSSGECDIEVPARAKDYFRVGDDYYKMISIPNKHAQLERTFKGRRKGTILDDHGKNFLQHIPKYESFCNVPNNTNFQSVIHNCFNVYNPLEFAPTEDPCTEEDCPTILSFLHHIFGDRVVSFKHPKTHDQLHYKNIDLALDYIQIAYQRPAEKLPILCLVSRDNNTGKSTFGNLLRVIFGSNVAIVGNQDLAGDFNAHWATKLFVVCDETKIDKQHVVEKVKSLSTATKITMNAKGKDHVEIDCFIKFIFITNNEENFIYMSEEDIRYWIIKVPVLKEENPSIVQNFIEEIPAFLSYLSQRQIKTEKLNRMWFYPSLLKTEAMRKVIAHSKPTVEKEIRERIREMFEDFGVEEILMTRNDIHKEFFKGKYEANYIKKVLTEDMKIDKFHELDPVKKDIFNNPTKIYKPTRYSYPKYDEQFLNGNKKVVRVECECAGRPYVFRREAFFNSEEIENLKVDARTAYETSMLTKQSIPSVNGTHNSDDPGGELPF